MQKSITKEVKKCFSKPTEKNEKIRGISLTKLIILFCTIQFNKKDLAQKHQFYTEKNRKKKYL